MKKRMMFLAVAAVAAAPAFGFSTVTQSGLAGESVPWMRLQGSARSAGMANVGSGLAGDIEALYQNPAAMSLRNGNQVLLQHHASFQGQAVENLAFGTANETSMLGVALTYIDFGGIEEVRVDQGTGAVTLGGTLAANGLAATLGLGKDLGKGVALGGAFKMIQQNIASHSASGFAVDAGLLWSSAGGTFSAGLSAANLGGDFDGSRLPTLIRAGLGTARDLPMIREGRLVAGLDLETSPAAPEAVAVQAGFEISRAGGFAARAGYRIDTESTLSGFSAGAGMGISRYRLDYAFGFEGILGQSHRVSVLMQY